MKRVTDKALNRHNFIDSLDVVEYIRRKVQSYGERNIITFNLVFHHHILHWLEYRKNTKVYQENLTHFMQHMHGPLVTDNMRIIHDDVLIWTKNNPPQLRVTLRYDRNGAYDPKCAVCVCADSTSYVNPSDQTITWVTAKWISFSIDKDPSVNPDFRLQIKSKVRPTEAVLPIPIERFNVGNITIRFSLHDDNICPESQVMQWYLHEKDISGFKRIMLNNRYFTRNSQHIAVRGVLSLEMAWEPKITGTIDFLPSSWISEIPLRLAQIVEYPPFSECARAKQVQNYWKVICPMFKSVACDWSRWDNVVHNPSLPRDVILAICRLAFLLPEAELADVAEVLHQFSQHQSKSNREEWLTEEIVEVTANNLATYDQYLEVTTKIELLEWICDRMSESSVAKSTFTGPLLHYLYNLADRIQRPNLSDNQRLLYKICKVVRWLEFMLPSDQQVCPKPLEVTPDEEDEPDDDDQEEQGEEDEEEQAEEKNSDNLEVAEPRYSFLSEDSHQPDLKRLWLKIYQNRIEPVENENENENTLWMNWWNNLGQQRKTSVETETVWWDNNDATLQKAMCRYLRRLCRSVKRACEELLNQSSD